MTDKKKTATKNKSNVMQIMQEKGKSPERQLAEMSLSAPVLNAVTTQTFSQNMMGEITMVGSSNLVVKQEDYSNVQFFVKLRRNDVTGWKTPLLIGLYENDVKIKTITANFMGPEVYE